MNAHDDPIDGAVERVAEAMEAQGDFLGATLIRQNAEKIETEDRVAVPSPTSTSSTIGMKILNLADRFFSQKRRKWVK